MTIQDLLDWFSQNENLILGYFIALLMLTIFIILIINHNNSKNLKYVISSLVYAVTIPGILSVMLTLYTIFMLQQNLLEVNIIAYFIPIVAMIVTLIIINKKISMSTIPGFDRLSGLMVMIGISFFIVFVLQKTHFGVLFIGGFSQLLIVFVVLLVILKIAWARISK